MNIADSTNVVSKEANYGSNLHDSQKEMDKLPHSGFSSKIEDGVISTPKGERPSPGRYMTDVEIKKHLALFDDGAVVFYTISKENADRAFKSPQDAYEVMIYAETGQWPNVKEEKKNADRELMKKFPELLIRIPSNQELFTEDELKELMPLARKALE